MAALWLGGFLGRVVARPIVAAKLSGNNKSSNYDFYCRFDKKIFQTKINFG
jgi:hypothetical protein